MNNYFDIYDKRHKKFKKCLGNNSVGFKNTFWLFIVLSDRFFLAM